MICEFCGSKRQVKQYLSVKNETWPNTGDISTSRVYACHDCTDPIYGGSESAIAPKTANL